MNRTITILVDEGGGAGIFLGGIEEDKNGWGLVVSALGQMQLFAQEKMIRLNIEAQSPAPDGGGQPEEEGKCPQIPMAGPSTPKSSGKK